MSTRNHVFILLGMPGVGKGTQAQKIAQSYDLFHIDTGQCLRAEISLATELGLTAKSYVDKGELVPFDLVMQVIKASMLRIPPDKKGYLFDGFPRNRAQADGLDHIVGDLDLTINAVLYLETPYGVLKDRLAYRVTCSHCDAKYNLKLNPPHQPGICDVCGNALVSRKDDAPEVIETRLQAYATETSPLIEYYEGRALLKRINADQTVEMVFTDIQSAMDPFFDPSDKIMV